MREFPDGDELVGFFEAEPAVLDPGVPWIYNTLEFSTIRNGIEIRARICPSYGELTLCLLLSGKELARFELKEAQAVRVSADGNREVLIVKFAEQSALLDFVLQLKPQVHLIWGNQVFP